MQRYLPLLSVFAAALADFECPLTVNGATITNFFSITDDNIVDIHTSYPDGANLNYPMFPNGNLGASRTFDYIVCTNGDGDEVFRFGGPDQMGATMNPDAEGVNTYFEISPTNVRESISRFYPIESNPLEEDFAVAMTNLAEGVDQTMQPTGYFFTVVTASGNEIATNQIMFNPEGPAQERVTMLNAISQTTITVGIDITFQFSGYGFFPGDKVKLATGDCNEEDGDDDDNDSDNAVPGGEGTLIDVEGFRAFATFNFPSLPPQDTLVCFLKNSQVSVVYQFVNVLTESFAVGDPHIRGFDGSMFNFGGEHGKSYAMYSDSGIQVNAQLGRFEVQGTDGTWITAVGVKFVDQTFVVNPSSGGVLINDKDFVASGVHNFNKYTLIVSENGHNVINKVVIQSSDLSITLKVIHFSSNIEDYFMNIQIGITKKPINPHGVIGQTARFILGEEQTNGIIEGTDASYEVENILGTKYTYSTFNAKNKRSFNYGFSPLTAAME